MFKTHPIEEGKNNILTGGKEHNLFLRSQNDSGHVSGFSGEECLGVRLSIHILRVINSVGTFTSNNARRQLQLEHVQDEGLWRL
jgi:hypothetical protein